MYLFASVILQLLFAAAVHDFNFEIMDFVCFYMLALQ